MEAAGSPVEGVHAEDGSRFTGDDRFMGDYLRSEFLDRVSRADVVFLTRSAVLDRMCGPLCDVTVGGLRSDRVLDRLERRNLLVIPLDRKGRWYRYHHLFRELLHAELLRREREGQLAAYPPAPPPTMPRRAPSAPTARAERPVESVEEVPPYHVRQMAAYVEALGVIFPGRSIEAALLYTGAPALFTLPPALLAAHKPGFVAKQQS